MAGVSVRPYEPRDADGFFEVMALTYNNGLPVENREDWVVDRDAFVAEADGRIVGGFFAHRFTATRGAATLRCGAVAGVAVAPDMRRGGIGARMMEAYSQYANRHGITLSSLYGFREEWYRRYGYEVAGRRIRIVCPSHRLPKIESELPVKRLGPDDWPLIEPCFLKFAHSRSGVNTRAGVGQWKRVLGENKPLTIYAFGDPVESYVAISHQTAFWVEQGVSEFVWTSRRGYEAGLSFLRQLGMNKTSVAWYEPSDSPFYAQYLDQGVEVRIERPIMFRVNDVRGALAAMPVSPKAGSGSFSVQLRDQIVPENEGCWRVDYSADNVSVSRTDSAGIRMDIRQFAQVFLGDPSLGELLRHEAVEVLDDRHVEPALRFFEPLPVYCGDFF